MYRIIFTLFLFIALSFQKNAVLAQQPICADALIDTYIYILQNKRIGLIINQSSVVQDSSLLDILISRGIEIKGIFVPEHGFRGAADAGAHIDNSVDSATGLPIYSLYGKNKKPAKEWLKDIDILVYDLQDVGVRFYTYISTLEYCMQACAENNIDFLVLDKPNPLGFKVDGPVLKQEFSSFVGMQKIPVVYGMTAGEYANMLKQEQLFPQASNLKLTVIKCKNYTHKTKYKLPVWPSPNLRTMAAIYLYPSLCFFEGTNISVGRGTNLPFQLYGCPDCSNVGKYTFTPTAGYGAKSPMFEGKLCYGELIAKSEQEALRQSDGGFSLKWLVKCYRASKDKTNFFTPFFNKLAGTDELQKMLKEGASEKQIKKHWQNDIESFKKVRAKYLLYPDFE